MTAEAKCGCGHPRHAHQGFYGENKRYSACNDCWDFSAAPRFTLAEMEEAFRACLPTGAVVDGKWEQIRVALMKRVTP